MFRLCVSADVDFDAATGVAAGADAVLATLLPELKNPKDVPVDFGAAATLEVEDPLAGASAGTLLLELNEPKLVDFPAEMPEELLDEPLEDGRE